MAIELWLAFVIASAVMVVIPGPTIITVVAYASAYGKKATLTLVAAVSLGDITVIGLSVLGLSSLLALSSTAFTVLKVGGGLYLIYLGVKMIRSANKLSVDIDNKAKTKHLAKDNRAGLFFNTWLVTALNPKGLLFFGAFLPQFVQADKPIAPQLAILTITFVCIAAINTFVYAVLATTAGQLVNSGSTKRRFNIGGGIAMASAGAWALITTAHPLVEKN